MGGKHKVANRTKNNARPSSSGRSAELLSNSIPQFASSSGIKEGLLFPGFSLSISEEQNSSIDPNFQLVLKKMTKKDSTTKIKGLQEFADLVKNSDGDTVKAVLPAWPRLYTSLATDTDNRVREAAHIAQHQIVLKVKRNIAPFLKQLMAPWFISQYDNYAPAATVACQAFKDAFPPNKFAEAIVYCQGEILAYINDNLLVQTAQTLSSAKTISAEDAEAKYERLLISCLQGYALYLEKVPTQQIEAVSMLNNEILSSKKFWKLAKHSTAQVRLAFFKVLAALCQKTMFLLDGKEGQITAAVFNNLEENDPTVLPYVWESALLIMSTVNEWWSFISVEKMYLQKLYKILKNGGHGNAVVIFPNLLPILSHLPPSVDANSSQFYSSFFENLQLGLKQKSVISSRSETAAIATALMECIQYAIVKNQSNSTLCKQLIKSYVITTIEWCLIENQASYKIIYNQIALVIQSWGRNSQKTDEFQTLLHFFFDNIVDLCEETLSNVKGNENFDLNSVASKQVEFLLSLKHIIRPKKQCTVTFASCDEKKSDGGSSPEVETVFTWDKNYFEQVNVVAYKICDNYVKYIDAKQSRELIEHLYSMVLEFNTRQFFEKMEKVDSLIDIYEKLLYNWLKSSHLRTKHVINLVFLLFQYVDAEGKNKILNSLSEFNDSDFLSWCLTEALAHPNNREPSIIKWLKSEQVSGFLISILEKEINDDCPPEYSALFKLALTENVDGELFIDKTALVSLIDKLIESLVNQSGNVITIDTCASLSAYISTIIYTENLLLTYSDTLLLALFKLSCKSYNETEFISSETLWEVNTSWQDSVAILLKHLGKEEGRVLTERFANVLEQVFLENAMDKSHVNHLITIVVSYMKSVRRSVPLQLNRLFGVFFERDFSREMLRRITAVCQAAEYICGELCSPYEEIGNEEVKVEEMDVLQYFVWSYVKLGVLSTNLNDEQDYDEQESDEEEESVEELIVLKAVDDSEEFIADILYDLCLSSSYLRNYVNTKQFGDIFEYNKLTVDRIKDTINKFDGVFSSKLKSLLKQKASDLSWFWCKTIYLLYTEIVPLPITDVFEEMTNNLTTENSLTVLHFVQIFGKHLNYDYIHFKLDTIGRIIVLRSLLHCDEIEVQIAEVFNRIESIRGENNLQFYNDSVNIPWEKAQQNIEIIRFCTNLIKYKHQTVNRRYCDFSALSLVNWSSNELKLRQHYHKINVQAFILSVTNLFVNIEKQINSLEEGNVKSKYVDDWRDLFMESIHSDLLQLWFYLSEQFEPKRDSLLQFLPFLMQFGTVISCFKSELIFKPTQSLPKWSKFLKRSCALLANSSPTLQLWGYKMLLVLVPGLVEIDTEAVNTNTPHRKGLIFEQFKERLVQTHEIVNTMLDEFKLGEDSCRVQPSTDSFTYTFAYLLLWDILLILCEKSTSELRYQYTDWLKNEDLLQNFLTNVFRLMPAEILHFNEGKSRTLLNVFLQRPPLEMSDSCASDKIEQFVCWLYAFSLAQLPALVRQWWTGIETRVAQIVEKVTIIYVSPNLCVQELADVAQHQTKFKNMVIKVIPSVREVVAIYTVDEAQMELVITLPTNYPLGGPDVQCNRQIGGTTHKQWLMQLKKCVLHQNGRIWDGLSLWNSNLDKKFDGVEECYICFAVLHPTYQLPKLSCHTCKKKFHSACLYKWFSTSNKSSCPICRNLF